MQALQTRLHNLWSPRTASPPPQQCPCMRALTHPAKQAKHAPTQGGSPEPHHFADGAHARLHAAPRLEALLALAAAQPEGLGGLHKWE